MGFEDGGIVIIKRLNMARRLLIPVRGIRSGAGACCCFLLCVRVRSRRRTRGWPGWTNQSIQTSPHAPIVLIKLPSPCFPFKTPDSSICFVRFGSTRCCSRNRLLRGHQQQQPPACTCGLGGGYSWRARWRPPPAAPTPRRLSSIDPAPERPYWSHGGGGTMRRAGEFGPGGIWLGQLTPSRWIAAEERVAEAGASALRPMGRSANPDKTKRPRVHAIHPKSRLQSSAAIEIGWL